MRISVAIPTYRRAWSLPMALDSLLRQSRRPDEVLVVLKPSGDGSEEVLRRYEGDLPLRVAVQRWGNFAVAVEMGIRLSRGDVVLFLDDDAVADARWIERYESLFGRVDRCGGISGVVVPARVVDGKPVPSARRDAWRPGRDIFYRRPIAGLEDYCAAFSVAGQVFSRCNPEGRIVQSLGFVGANMGFRREAVLDSRLAELYGGSRRCAHNEDFLALRAVLSGYRACLCRDPARCPAVLHISDQPSLTRRSGPYQEFWSQYDRARNFHRLRKMGVRTSTSAYLAWMIASLRRSPAVRLLASIYAQFARDQLHVERGARRSHQLRPARPQDPPYPLPQVHPGPPPQLPRYQLVRHLRSINVPGPRGAALELDPPP